jgi:hypothetical protein
MQADQPVRPSYLLKLWRIEIMKTSELNGRALAYAVGLAENCYMETWHTKSVAILFPGAPRAVPWNPHTDWAQGGPIIEREGIELKRGVGKPILWAAFAYDWFNNVRRSTGKTGETALIAAMRCYVSSKLGNEVEIPEELKP